MKGVIFSIVGVICAGYSMAGYAEDCWQLSDSDGRNALASEEYHYHKDSFPPAILCFTKNGGHVSDDDLTFVKFGQSTLVGLYRNEAGFESVGMYQIDRRRGIFLYTHSRVGAPRTYLDGVAAFVGKAIPLDR